MKFDVHFSTGKDNWETPDDLFEKYDGKYHFILDAAADETNHKCDRWFGPGGEETDALSAEWPLVDGAIWLNPPYSRGAQTKFLKKVVEQVQKHGGTVVCLLPARTDTVRFHKYVLPYGEITFLKGRVKFVGAEHGAPFPSMIVVFKKA